MIDATEELRSLPNGDAHGKPNPGPRLRFMIVGVARSGTTLIQRLASELDGVWVPAESHFWRHATQLALRVDWPLAAEALDEFLGSFRTLPGLCDFEFDHEAARAHLPETPWLWDVFEAVTVAAAPPTARVIGEKTPAHHRWAHRLLTEVESLRVIGVRRDPYQTFASHLDVPWGVKDPVEFAVRWRTADDELRLLERNFPDRVLVLDHEPVSSAPDEARARIADLLGVEPRTRPSSPGEIGRLFDPAETWKTNATGAIRPSSRSRDDLPARTAAVLASVLEGDIPPALSSAFATAVETERRIAAISAHPLPVTAESSSAWQRSDMSLAARLRADLDRANDRLDEVRATAQRWQSRAEELNKEQKRTSAELSKAHSTNDRLRARVESLQRRRSVRAADALGRLVGRGGSN